jgi:hypothetical protein
MESVRSLVRRITLLLPLAIVAVIACDGDDGIVDRELLAGSWGGDGVEMVVDADSVIIQFECDDARAPVPAVDDDGRFEGVGVYRVFGGIVFQVHEGVIRGRVAGTSVAGEFVFDESARLPVSFEVRFGEEPEFEGCLLAVADSGGARTLG